MVFRHKPTPFETAEADLLELHEVFVKFHESVQVYLKTVEELHK